ncbi:MAG: hypothetical protein V7640_2567 [Betaproteobacteria bacterium]|jgi:hypothetical protein
MVKKLVLAGAVVLAFSNVASAQTTTIPGGINPGTSGLGPDISTPVPGTAGTINSGDPRRAPSGSRANDSSRMGTTGGVDAGSALGGTTDPITGRPVTGSGAGMGSGSIGSGPGVGASGSITSGAGAPLPGAGGMSGSGSMSGAAGAGGAGAGGAGMGGAGMGGAGAAGAGGAGGAR